MAVDAQTLASGQTVLAVRIITPLVGGRGVCIPSEEESAKCGLVERPPVNSRKLLQGTFSDEVHVCACLGRPLGGAASGCVGAFCTGQGRRVGSPLKVPRTKVRWLEMARRVC